jgi:hypothetical protein
VKYIFVDEAGNLDFSNKGTKYFLFTFLVKKRPFELENKISKLKFDLIEWSVENNKHLDLEYFHATEDNTHIRKRMFELIINLDNSKIEVYTYILEKNKVFPEKREDKDKFYINNLKYATINVLSHINEDFVIFTDRLPIKHNKTTLIKGLKKGIREHLDNNHLPIKYGIFHHSSASNAYLQVVDYINWAVFRKYERDDSNYYDMIKKYIKVEEILTKGRSKCFY